MLLATANMPNELLFQARTALGFSLRMQLPRWRLIVNQKHPAMNGRERDVEEALRIPEEIRPSRSDKDVYLFYRREHPNRWVCVVVKRLDGDGFVITAYPTDTIEEGERIWAR